MPTTVEPDSNRLSGISYDASGNQRQLIINSSVSLSFNCCENLVYAGIIERPNEMNDADYYVYDSSERRRRKVGERFYTAGAVNYSDKIYLGNYELLREGIEVSETENIITSERQGLRIMDGDTCIAILYTWVTGGPDGGSSNPAPPQLRYQLSNNLGSVTLELDTQAQLISYEEYFPFGGTAIIAGMNQVEVSLKEYRYSGKECDDSTGLYYYGARYYIPWLGRWLKPDPAGTVDGPNLFAYVSNNPITMTDSNGLAQEPATKKQRKEEAPAVRAAINKAHGGGLELAKQIHSSHLYVGSTEVVVPPSAMSRDRLLVRHISTALLAQDKGMIEVQSAIDHKNKTIYIASNKKQSTLAGFLEGSATLKDFKIPKGKGYNDREVRHIVALAKEIGGAFKDYKIEHVSGHEDQHAETKIVEAGKSFDYIGGTRRPCLACYLFFQINKIKPSTYNPHAGAFWDSIAALLSLGMHAEDIADTIAEGILYTNKDVAKAERFDYDTDSDGEEESKEEKKESPRGGSRRAMRYKKLEARRRQRNDDDDDE